jgi:two-component sensor histidine kinase
VTDAGVTLTGARYGAFLYDGGQAGGRTLFTLSETSRSAFEALWAPAPRPAFDGPIRSDDITQDARLSPQRPSQEQPSIRSYLAVSVRSRTGETIGSLFFGHPDAGVFTERAEWILSGVAAQAGIALDNARLYQAAQSEISERRNAEERQRLLINELNHRVKNTLTTVQSIAAQTLRPMHDLEAAKEALTSRIIALSRAHDVITARTWQGAELREIVERAVEPFSPGPNSRFKLDGPEVWLQPRSALAIAMALHELGTNAVKYGALSEPAGSVRIAWTVKAAAEATELGLVWTERGGPPVALPATRGFGSRLIERGLRADLSGSAQMDFEADGLVCRMTAMLPPAEAPAEARAAG